MVYDYKISDDILENMENGKFYKKNIRKILKDVMKSFGLKKVRGSKEIDIMAKINDDGSIVVYEISEFEKEYGYWILLFDSDGNLIYDEADGEIENKNKIYEYYRHIDSVEVKNRKIEQIRLKLFYPYRV